MKSGDNPKLRIDALFAWVATHPERGEGVCSALVNGMHMPLIGADMERVKSLRLHAEHIHEVTGYPVSLIRFVFREDMETL